MPREGSPWTRLAAVTLKELAYLLGFGELGSLHRACLRWFGMSPARYRAQRAAATMAPKQK